MAAPMLPANAPVLASLALPHEYGVTDAGQWGTAAMLEKLEQGLARGLKLVQLREPEERRDFVDQAIERARRYGCKVMVKWPHPRADGMHLTAAQLMALRKRPEYGLVAASCHTREELERAMALRARLRGARAGKGEGGFRSAGVEAICRNRARHDDSGVRDRRPAARRHGRGVARRRARPRYDPGGVGLGSCGGGSCSSAGTR